jgi:RNA polymerase sigma factor (sigma-70 family)
MRPTHLFTDQALLEMWCGGDVRAGAALLARHAPSLLRFFRRRASADADELLQATLLACVETHRRFRGEATFRSYMFTIARHELQRCYRERARRQCQVAVEEVTLVDPVLSSADQLAQLQLHAAVQEALTHLSAADRTLLRRFYHDDVDSSELALEHGLKPSSVRARLHRARRELAQRIRSASGEPRQHAA